MQLRKFCRDVAAASRPTCTRGHMVRSAIDSFGEELRLGK
jgi:hypothetical protein